MFKLSTLMVMVERAVKLQMTYDDDPLGFSDQETYSPKKSYSSLIPLLDWSNSV